MNRDHLKRKAKEAAESAPEPQRQKSASTRTSAIGKAHAKQTTHPADTQESTGSDAATQGADDMPTYWISQQAYDRGISVRTLREHEKTGKLIELRITENPGEKPKVADLGQITGKGIGVRLFLCPFPMCEENGRGRCEHPRSLRNHLRKKHCNGTMLTELRKCERIKGVLDFAHKYRGDLSSEWVAREVTEYNPESEYYANLPGPYECSEAEWQSHVRQHLPAGWRESKIKIGASILLNDNRTRYEIVDIDHFFPDMGSKHPVFLCPRTGCGSQVAKRSRIWEHFRMAHCGGRSRKELDESLWTYHIDFLRFAHRWNQSNPVNPSQQLSAEVDLQSQIGQCEDQDAEPASLSQSNPMQASDLGLEYRRHQLIGMERATRGALIDAGASRSLVASYYDICQDLAKAGGFQRPLQTAEQPDFEPEPTANIGILDPRLSQSNGMELRQRPIGRDELDFSPFDEPEPFGNDYLDGLLNVDDDIDFNKVDTTGMGNQAKDTGHSFSIPGAADEPDRQSLGHRSSVASHPFAYPELEIFAIHDGLPFPPQDL